MSQNGKPVQLSQTDKLVQISQWQTRPNASKLEK